MRTQKLIELICTTHWSNVSCFSIITKHSLNSQKVSTKYKKIITPSSVPYQEPYVLKWSNKAFNIPNLWKRISNIILNLPQHVTLRATNISSRPRFRLVRSVPIRLIVKCCTRTPRSAFAGPTSSRPTAVVGHGAACITSFTVLLLWLEPPGGLCHHSTGYVKLLSQ